MRNASNVRLGCFCALIPRDCFSRPVSVFRFTFFFTVLFLESFKNDITYFLHDRLFWNINQMKETFLVKIYTTTRTKWMPINNQAWHYNGHDLKNEPIKINSRDFSGLLFNANSLINFGLGYSKILGNQKNFGLMQFRLSVTSAYRVSLVQVLLYVSTENSEINCTNKFIPVSKIKQFKNT